MSTLGDLYSWVDKNVAGGYLPGGAPTSAQATATATQRLAAQLAPQGAAGAAYPATVFGGGAALSAAAGMPVSAGAATGGARGRTVTAIATVLPNGQIIPRRMLPGSPVAMSSDLSAVRRLKRARTRINRMFPAARRPKARSYRPAKAKASKK